MRPTSKRLAAAAAALLAGLLLVIPTPAQESDLTTRDMQDSDLFKARPRSKSRAPRKARVYQRTSAPRPAPATDTAAAEGAEVGFTAWRMRPSVAGDPEGVRDIVHETSGTVSVTPERIAGELALAIDERYRFAIESSRPGYLYVVNRPIYEAGPRPPVLIFPTRRIRGGANEVTGGTLVELPAPYDSPPYYTVRAPSGRLVAEEIILLVTPKRLDLPVGDGPITLTAETVAEWERRWGVAPERFEYKEGKGMVYTAEERAARQDPAYRLDDAAAPPQLLFRVPARRDDPVFLRVRVEVRAATARW